VTNKIFLSCIIIILILPFVGIGQKKYDFSIKGLKSDVEIIIDQWGVPHIYAQNEEDLFFAQGFHAAKDRLFQFEIWRRQATGTVAEILGPRELKRDIGTRLFKFRGDIEQEMNHYHPNGKSIVTSFVKGVNAYIELTESKPDLLPLEFQLLNIKPQKWTPEIVISRHQGLLGNIGNELKYGRLVDLIGVEKLKELIWFHPNDPDLIIDDKINSNLLHHDILDLYNAYRKPVKFEPDDIAYEYRNQLEKFKNLASIDIEEEIQAAQEEINTIGSNNWIINGNHTQSGFPIMANDPHRTQAVPSLRYMAHLVAPGWNVIGGGEPEIPGISIGHNEHGAWGLTVFRTDAEDLYVYDTNPNDRNSYMHNGRWTKMTKIKESIPVKGKKNENVELKYTVHGPVVYEDLQNNVAYAVRCGWLEIGGSPYLASLRMNQSKNFEEFREACNYSHIPGENMIWADKEGNIGWQAVGISPIRSWSGLVPVPGDGSHEWEGYREIKDRPHIYNPPSGIFGTSNENVTPNSYPLMKEISYEWSDPYRGDRVMEVLGSGRQHTMMDMVALQTDYLSIPARELVPLLLNINWENEQSRSCVDQLKEWNYELDPNSTAAAIYVAFEDELRKQMNSLLVPEKAKGLINIQMKKVIDFLMFPDSKFGNDAVKGRDEFIKKSFEQAVTSLTSRFGDEIAKWTYGGKHYKHIVLKHPMSNAVSDKTREKLEVGPAPRGGNSYTVNMTSSNLNQRSGGSFKIISDTGNWDHALATNTPGQNGDSNHPHYKNLFDLWSRDQYFPLFFSRKKIEGVKSETWNLRSK
jgi:penicillin amidase